MIRLVSGLSVAALLLIGNGHFRLADASDPDSHVRRKANAGCPANILTVQDGSPKASQAQKFGERSTASDADAGQQTNHSLYAVTMELVGQSGNRKPVAGAPVANTAGDSKADVVDRRETEDEQIVQLNKLANIGKQEAGGPSTTQAGPPQLFRWNIARPTDETRKQAKSMPTSSPAQQRPVAIQSQRKPNGATMTAEQFVLLGPIELTNTNMRPEAAVTTVQAELDSAASLTGDIAQAEATDGGPDQVPEQTNEAPLVMDGQNMSEPGLYGDEVPLAYPPYAPQGGWSIPWEVFAQGEYIGPARTPHVPEYRLRVDDQIEFVYRLNGQKSAAAYRINLGDSLQIESLTAENLNRVVIVQPDGTISLRQLGQVPAAGRTVDELRNDLDERYSQFVQNPTMSVDPLTVNTTLEQLRATVDNRAGSGGQGRLVTVTPEGTVQLPAIGSVPAHGLSLDELAYEVELRYASIVDGLEVTPILQQRAPRYVYVVGEVVGPGRYTLEAPTSVMQAISLAGGWNNGGNLREVVIFRRDDNWRLLACKVNIRAPLYGKDLCPQGDIWLRDSDIVVVPKNKIKVADDFIELVFTRGIYGVLPFGSSVSFVKQLSTVGGTITPIPAAP